MTEEKKINRNHKTGSGYPLGAHRTENGVMFSAYLPYRRSFELIIYDSRGQVKDHVNMLDHVTASGVMSCVIEGKWDADDSYCYEIDGVRASDPFMRSSAAVRKYGDHVAPSDNGKLYSPDFDWDGDEILHLPYDQVIAYQLHVRGFSAHSSSKVRSRSTSQKFAFLSRLSFVQTFSKAL